MVEKYSYSKVDTYQQCPYKYKLKYVDGNFVKVDTLELNFGTLIHECEEQIGKYIINGKSINYEEIKEKFNNGVNLLKEKYKEKWNKENKDKLDYNKKASKYLKNGIYNLENMFNENQELYLLGVEVPFNIEYNNKLFSGSIDRLMYDKKENKFIIIDLKTWTSETEETKGYHSLQFYIYSLAVKQLYGNNIKIECMYLLPIINKTQIINLDEFLSKNKLDSFFNRIEKEDYSPTASNLCYWCEFSKTHPLIKDCVKCNYCSSWTPKIK